MTDTRDAHVQTNPEAADFNFLTAIPEGVIFTSLHHQYARGRYGWSVSLRYVWGTQYPFASGNGWGLTIGEAVEAALSALKEAATRVELAAIEREAERSRSAHASKLKAAEVDAALAAKLAALGL